MVDLIQRFTFKMWKSLQALIVQACHLQDAWVGSSRPVNDIQSKSQIQNLAGVNENSSWSLSYKMGTFSRTY